MTAVDLTSAIRSTVSYKSIICQHSSNNGVNRSAGEQVGTTWAYNNRQDDGRWCIRGVCVRSTESPNGFPGNGQVYPVRGIRPGEINERSPLGDGYEQKPPVNTPPLL